MAELSPSAFCLFLGGGDQHSEEIRVYVDLNLIFALSVLTDP